MRFAHPGRPEPALVLADYRAAPPLWRLVGNQRKQLCGRPKQGVAVLKEPHHKRTASMDSISNMAWPGLPTWRC